MASLRQIRRRMKSIENIHEITKAMEMIAAFRFKKAEVRFSRSRAYLSEMEAILANLSGSAENLTHPLFEKRKAVKKTLIVMTGDKGLCGAYNANVLRAANHWLKENREADLSFVPVGKVGYETLKKRQLVLAAFYPEKTGADLDLAKKITEDVKDLFLKKQADSVELLYTSYRAGGTGQNKIVPFLPLNHLVENRKTKGSPVDYIYEPDFNSVFFSLLQKFLEGKMYLTLLESLTSEYSARMIAMKQATENGEEVLDNLRLLRNKTRQATITRELSEIVSGASILV